MTVAVAVTVSAARMVLGVDGSFVIVVSVFVVVAVIVVLHRWLIADEVRFRPFLVTIHDVV